MRIGAWIAIVIAVAAATNMITITFFLADGDSAPTATIEQPQPQPVITHGPAPTELFVEYAAIEGVMHEGQGYACAPTYTTVDLLVGGTVTYGRLPIRTVLTQTALEIVYNGSNSSYALIITGQDGKEYPVAVPTNARPNMGIGPDKQHTMVVKLENMPGHQVSGVVSCSYSR